MLGDGQRVIGRTSATEMLTGIKGGGGLEKYLGVATMKPFIDRELVLERLVSFRLPEVEGLDTPRALALAGGGGRARMTA